MADYINNNILCQAYIHVEPQYISSEELVIITENLEDFVKSRASFFLYPEADVEIKHRKGSLILYATVLGSVTFLFSAVKTYPSFREGVIVLYEDVRRLAEYITSESIFCTKAKHNQVIRVEARTGVIGTIRKIITQFDNITGREGVVPVSLLTKELVEVEVQIQRLLGNLKTQDDLKTIKDGMLEMVISLPATPRAPKNTPIQHNDVAAYKQKIIDLLNMLK